MTTALLIAAIALFAAPLVLFLVAAVAVEIRDALDDRRGGRGVLIDQRPPATIHSLEMHRRRRVNARRAQGARMGGRS